MANLTNLTSYHPPAPIYPTLPNFAVCDVAYGAGLTPSEARFGAGLLPQGSRPIPYTVDEPLQSPGYYDLPYYSHYGSVAITVDAAGAVDIDSIMLVPNQVRGMAAFVAEHCVLQQGRGGFITQGLQDLVDYVTDPTSNLQELPYPPSTAFITVLVSDREVALSAPGDFDPSIAYVLEKAEITALSRVEPQYREIISERALWYLTHGMEMARLGGVTWWEGMDLGANRTDAATPRTTNAAMQRVTTSRRRNRARGLSVNQGLEKSEGIPHLSANLHE